MRRGVIIEVHVDVQVLPVEVLVRASAQVFGIVEQTAYAGNALNEAKKIRVLHQRVEARMLDLVGLRGHCQEVVEDERHQVVLEGALEIVHPRPDGSEQLIVVHAPGQFTGEVNQLAERRTLVRGRAKERSRVIELQPAELKKIVLTDYELSEIFLRAYMLRRMGLLAGNQGDAIVLGSSHSAATLRVRGAGAGVTMLSTRAG